MAESPIEEHHPSNGTTGVAHDSIPQPADDPTPTGDQVPEVPPPPAKETAPAADLALNKKAVDNVLYSDVSALCSKALLINRLA
jgi:hypothetical protein